MLENSIKSTARGKLGAMETDFEQEDLNLIPTGLPQCYKLETGKSLGLTS